MRISAAITAERILPERLAVRARPAAERLDRLLAGADPQNRAGRMSLIAFAVRIAGAALAFVSQVLLARWMGGFEYGVFVFVWTAVIILGNLSCFGVHTTVIRFVPGYIERGESGRLRGVLLGSRLFVLASSSALAVLGISVLVAFDHRIDAHYLLPLMLGAVCLPMMAMSDLMQGFARAHAWPFRSMLPTYLVRPLLLLALMAAALSAGMPADATTALIAAIVATLLTTLGQLLAISNPADRSAGGGARRYMPKLWLAVSLPVFLVEGFQFLLTNADVLLVGLFLPPTDVAVYFAAVKTLALVHFVSFAVKAGAAQHYAQLVGTGDRASLAAFARRSVAWTFWPSLGFALLLLAAGRLLLSLFGAEFVAGYPLLAILVAGVVVRAAVGPAESLLTMSGHQNACAAVYAVVLIINIGLNVVLIRSFGLAGAAAATAVAMMCEALLLAVTVRRRLGLAMWIGAQRQEGAVRA